MKKNNGEEALRCSFCNKSQNDVRKLIAGPTVFICDECVRVCNDIIDDDQVVAAHGLVACLRCCLRRRRQSLFMRPQCSAGDQRRVFR